MGYEQPRIIGQEVTVQPAQFTPLPDRGMPREAGNIGLIMDVTLQVSVELGRTRKKIKEILEMGPGYVIQLDKMAGEPVDLLVNGKLIAKGEVVVIDENYGLRITTIISPTERVSQLQ
jgi:flagellar motor switch protein FliN/FliY